MTIRAFFHVKLMLLQLLSADLEDADPIVFKIIEQVRRLQLYNYYSPYVH
jgi:hypothetical protein